MKNQNWVSKIYRTIIKIHNGPIYEELESKMERKEKVQQNVWEWNDWEFSKTD